MICKEKEALASRFVSDIERACEPGKMSKREALEFTEDIISRLEASCEALREEIEAEEGDDE